MSLLSDVSIAVTPNGYKAEKLYAVVPSSGAADMVVTRATDATRVNEDGLIESVLSNVPRIDYTGGGCPHILAEPQSTNVLPYSEDFSQSSWIKNDVSIESGYLAPDGTSSAYKVTKTGSNAHIVDIATGGNVATKSIYAKTSSGTGTVILFNNTSVYFTITEEWQRFDVQQNGLDFFYAVDFRGASTLTEIIIWGAQSEALSYPTSYIPTSGSAVTRNKDQFTRNNLASLINSTEGALFIEMAALANDGTNRVISLSDGTSSNRVLILYQATSNLVRGQLSVSGQSSITIDKSLDTTQFIKIAINWNSTSVKLYIDGLEIAETSTGYTFAANTLNRLAFDNVGSSDFFGKVKQLQVYKTALTDSRLAALTS